MLLVLVIDGPIEWEQRPLLLAAVADETAHLLTAALLLAAVPWLLPTAFVVAALLGSVLIDLDHLPLLFGSDLLTRETARPFTHSLLTIGLIVGLTLSLRPRWQRVGWGLATGIAAHLVRDLASTSAGVPLFWPVMPDGFTLPQEVYFALLMVCCALVWRNAHIKHGVTKSANTRDGSSPAHPY